jgi:hypothetical protein
MENKGKPTKEHDFSVNAFRVVQEATGQVESKQEQPESEKKPDTGKNPNAVALGRLGGLKGGRARLEKMTPEQRQEIARKAAQKRWAK